MPVATRNPISHTAEVEPHMPRRRVLHTARATTMPINSSIPHVESVGTGCTDVVPPPPPAAENCVVRYCV